MIIQSCYPSRNTYLVSFPAPVPLPPVYRSGVEILANVPMGESPHYEYEEPPVEGDYFRRGEVGKPSGGDYERYEGYGDRNGYSY